MANKEDVRKITVNAEFIASLKNMNEVVSGINKGLKEAQYNTNKQLSFDKKMDSFKDAYNKVLSYINDKNEVNFIDFSQFEKDVVKVKNVFKEISQIGKSLKEIDIPEAKNLFPDSFKSTRKDLEGIVKTIREYNSLSRTNRVDSSKLLVSETELRTAKEKGLKSSYENEIQRVSQEIKTTEKEIQQLTNDFEKNFKDRILGNTDKRTSQYKTKNNLIKEIDETTQKLSELEEQRKKIAQDNNKTTYRGKIFEDINNQIKETKDNLKNVKDQLDSFNKTQQEKADKEFEEKTSSDNYKNEIKGYKEKNDLLEEQKNKLSQLQKQQKEAYDTEEKQNADITKKEEAYNKLKDRITETNKKLSEQKQIIDKIDYDLLEKMTGLNLKDKNISDLTSDELASLNLTDSQIDNYSYEQLKNTLQNLYQILLKIDPAVASSTNELEKMGDTAKDIKKVETEMDNLKQQVLDFFSLTNTVDVLKRLVSSSFETVKTLDATMTEAAVVTDFSIGDMWSQLPTYTEEAKKLGVATNDLYGATTLYYQQGLKTNEAMSVGVETMKMAKVGALESADATQLMTAALRGFNMEVNETSAQRVNDVYSELAAITAADTSQIGIAMSKTASIAASANMEFETTSALLSQIIETTQEAPETAGTALKTIIARFTEVKELFSQGQLMGQDEEGEEININKIDAALKTVGISLKDFLNGSKGLDDILLELASKWDSLDIATQRYIATTAAGSRQQSRFLAMMGDYDRTMELVDAANNSAGASQEQFNKTLDSLDSKLNNLKNAWDQFIMGLANADVIKFGIDLLTGLLNIVNGLIGALSGNNGLTKMLLSLGTVLATFKIGKTIFGNTTLGKNAGSIFSTFFGKDRDIETIAKQKGEKSKKGFLKGFNIKDLFKVDFKMNVGDDFVNAFSEMGTEARNALIKNVDFRNILSKTIDDQLSNENTKTKDTKKKNILSAFDSGDTDKFNKALKEANIQLKITDEMSKTSAYSISALSDAVGLAGGAFMILSSFMNTSSDDGVKVQQTLQAVATGLMAFPFILQTIQAAATALGISITSIPVIGWIAGIISGLIALAGIISALVDTNEEKIDKLNDKIDKSEQEIKEAQEAIEDLTTSSEKLNEINNTLDQLVEGTTEWTKKLIEANQQVLDLIEKYPYLRQYLEIGEKGQLSIKDEGFENLLQKQNERELNNQLQQLSNRQKIEEINLTTQVEDTRFQLARGETDNASDFDSDRKSMSGVDKDQFRQIAIDMFDKGINSQNINDNISEVEKIYKDNINVPFDKEKFDNFIHEINTLGEDFDSLSNSLKQSQIQLDAERKAMVNVIATQSEFANSPYLDQLVNSTDMAYEDLNSIIDKATEEAKNEDGSSNGITNESKEKYSEITGLDISEIDEKIKNNEITTDQIMEAIGADQVQQEMESYMNEVNNFILTNNENMALIGALSTEGQQLTKDQITELQQSLGDNATIDDIIEKYNIENTENGKKIAQSILDGYEKAAEGFEIAEKELSSIYTGESINGYTGEQLLKKNITQLNDEDIALTSGQLKGLSENLSAVAKSGGDAIKTSEIINDIYEKSGDQLPEVLNILSATDFTDKTSIDNTIQSLKEMGIEIEDNLVEQIYDATEAIRQFDLTQIKDQIKSILELREDILDRDPTDIKFSEEEYNQLINAGLKPEDFLFDGKDYNYIAENGIQQLSDALLLAGENKLVEAGEQLANYIAIGAKFDEYKDLDSFEKAMSLMSKENPEQAIAEEFSNSELKTMLDSLGIKYDQYASNETLAGVFANNYNNAYGLGGTKYLENQAEMEQQKTNIENYKYGQAETGYDAIMAGSNLDLQTSALEKLKAQYGITSEEIDKYVGSLKNSYGANKLESNVITALGIDYVLTARKIDSMNETLQENSEILNDESKRTTIAYNEALTDVAEKAREVFGQHIDNKFVEENLNDLMALQEGGDAAAEAWDRLSIASVNAYLDSQNITEATENFKGLQSIISQIDGMDIAIGGTADFSDIFSQLVTLMGDVEKAKAFLESMNYTVELEPIYQKTTNLDPTLAKLMGMPTQTIAGWKTKVTKNDPVGTRTPSIYNGNGGSSSNSSGGSSSKEEEPWISDYDWLYNLVEKTNEELRNRNKLEWEYSKIIKNNADSIYDVYKNMQAQEESLKRQQDYYDQQLQGRLKEQADLEKEYSDVRKYASYNENLGYVEINWNAIESLSGKTGNNKTGERIDEYISKLEQLSSQIDQIEDSQMDIIDQLESLNELGKDEYLNIEQRVYDAIVQLRQDEIDRLSDLNESINEANTSVLDKIQTGVDEFRNARQLEEDAKNISEMEGRLALMQTDTSGSNALDILQLQEELRQARQDYTDSLIDKSINEMTKQNEQAYEQRMAQIELMTAQLEWDKESGIIAQQTNEMIKNGILSGPENIKNMLEQTDVFKGMAAGNQEDWIKTFEEGYKAGMAWWVKAEEHQLSNAGLRGKQIKFTDATGIERTGIVQSNGTVKVGNTTYSGIYRAPDGTWQQGIDGKTNTSNNNSSSSSKPSNSGGTSSSTPKVGGWVYIAKGARFTNGEYIDESVRKKGFHSSKPGGFYVYQKSGDNYLLGNGGPSKAPNWTGWMNKKYLTSFKTGGLANFTGPAWLDGKKSHPEYILNAKQTEGWLQLTDVLSNFNNLKEREPNGDNYFDIHIEVDSLNNDYDVEQISNKIKRMIEENAAYRNVNAVDLGRR